LTAPQDWQNKASALVAFEKTAFDHHAIQGFTIAEFGEE
jgi:hypothetical protein